ncbi:MAG: DUF2175 domain-containing protein [Thermoproteus sp.]
MKRWTCYVCGRDVVEGQIFTFTSKGAVHLSCLHRSMAPRLYRNNTDAALFELMTFANEGIVKVKNVEDMVEDEEVRKLVLEFRKSLEGFAARLTNKLVERTGA